MGNEGIGLVWGERSACIDEGIEEGNGEVGENGQGRGRGR